jgi:hypothetical protein
MTLNPIASLRGRSKNPANEAIIATAMVVVREQHASTLDVGVVGSKTLELGFTDCMRLVLILDVQKNERHDKSKLNFFSMIL